ncbi:MAG: hypothetical protein M5U19_23250 [Microthrixaceae bacterium]|nr:hypothetical protein [Microthrixaceae bacterium]
MAITVDVDLRVDLQTMDETGLPWALLDAAPNSSRIVPGGHIVAGSGSAIAVAVVVDITDEGIVHVHPSAGLSRPTLTYSSTKTSAQILHPPVCQKPGQLR